MVPQGPLGPDTVPAAVLAIPVALAIENLVQHAKKCRNPHCSHVPAPLHAYLHMRPEAIRKARDNVCKVLWTHPSHELVAFVRKAIIDKYSDLAKAISAGSLLDGDTLGELLPQLGPNGIPVLAAVLWASKFNGPGAETLFRNLVPLAARGTSAREDRPAERDDRRLKELEGRLRTTVKERREAKQKAEEAERQLTPKTRALQKALRDLESVRKNFREACEEIDRLEKLLDETEAALQALQRDGEKTAKVSVNLRQDLRRLQQIQRELEAGRGELARTLAAARHRIEHLKADLEVLPRGVQAAWEFLHSEEDRIQQDRIILSGGAKKVAEQAWANHRKLEKAFLEAYPVYRQPRPRRIRQKTPLRFVALGGSGEVGRSSYLVELGKRRILIDCGIRPSGSQDLHPDLSRLEHLDALILTHAHSDHIGWVPALVRKFPEIDIYCSDGTAALLPIMLEDCHTHYMRKIAHSQEIAQHIRNADVVEVEYEEEDVHLVPRLAITCPLDQEEPLPFGDMSIRLFQAGHILGAASVLIEDQSGRKIFLSGDFSSFEQLTVPAARWPTDLGEIDLLVLESTYGLREHHEPIAESRQELLAIVREITEGHGGSAILASFALGRAQELLKLLVTARQSGGLSSSIPIHVDGMIRRINPIYRSLGNFDVAPPAYNEVSGEAERQDVVYQAQVTPTIIVTTSGMLAGGPVVEYARRLLPDPRHRIILTGYQDEGAPSRALRDLTGKAGSKRIVQVPDETGETVEFEAAMPAKVVGLSAHADRAGLVEYASQLNPRHIALVHGEADAQEALRSRLQKVHPGAEITCAPSELAVP